MGLFDFMGRKKEEAPESLYREDNSTGLAQSIGDILGMGFGAPAQPGYDLEQTQAVGRNEVNKAVEILRKYKEGKSNLDAKIVSNEQWWKSRQWDEINRLGTGKTKQEDGATKQQERVQPVSAWLFNSLSNKHADIMDNYPAPNVLPRERNDKDDAKALAGILPVIMERNDFEDVYSLNAWDKLKNGLSAYGVFWDSSKDNGVGDITIRPIDVLNLYWQPGIMDIQRSANLFVVALEDEDVLERRYPQLKGKLGGDVIDVKQYIYDDTVDTTNKHVVVDWYYKKETNTGTVLHYCKFVGNEVLYASENDPDYTERGYYDHGKYPVIIDCLFPNKGTVAGFGYLDVMKDPQMYIDKLNQILLENSYLVGKPRFMVRDSSGINEEEFADWSKSFVHVAGSVSEEHIRQIEVRDLPAYVTNLLDYKVNELKETSGNRDFSQGSTSSGVTAASAIAALQEAGNKLSRDMIKGNYRAYREICYMCIELIRQFYDEEREFRILGENGQSEFEVFSNANIKGQQLPAAYDGQQLEPGYTPAVRIPVFDIVVKAEKSNPFSRASQNEMAKEFYGMGFFNPQMCDQALAALDMMDFEGKQSVVERISNNGTMMQQIQMLQAQLAKLSMIVQSVTGAPVYDQLNVQAGAEQQPSGGTKSMEGQAMQRAADNANNSLTDRIVANATPDVSRQDGITQ